MWDKARKGERIGINLLQKGSVEVYRENNMMGNREISSSILAFLSLSSFSSVSYATSIEAACGHVQERIARQGTYRGPQSLDSIRPLISSSDAFNSSWDAIKDDNDEISGKTVKQ